MNTIKKEWETYLKHVMPKNVSQTQFTETRRAFYAGSTAIINMLGTLDDSVSDEAGAYIMDGLYQECLQFADDIQKGKA